MDKNGRGNSLDNVITLSVCTIPGMRQVDVPLEPDTTAGDVIDYCRVHLKSQDNYNLAADFDGFEKQFGIQERLFNLVKKQILVNNQKNSVKFFLRKRKRSSDKNISDSLTSTEAFLIHQIASTSDLHLDSLAIDQLMAVPNSMSSQNVSPFATLSYTDLVQLAERQKRHIESNNIVIAHKESRLKSIRTQAQTRTSNDATVERLHKLRNQVQAEEAQLQRMRRLRGEAEEERQRDHNAQSELSEARRMYAEKERQLREASERVEEMSRRLDMFRRKRMLIAKESELSRLDEKLASLSLQASTKSTSNVAQPVPTSNVLPTSEQQTKFAVKTSSTSSMLSSVHQRRPKAAIEPFKVVPPQPHDQQQRFDAELSRARALSQQQQQQINQSSTMNNDYLASKGFVTAFSAMEEVLQHQLGDTSFESKSNSSDSNLTPLTFDASKIYAKPTQQKNSIETSLLLNGYGNTAKSSQEETSPDEGSAGRRVKVSINRRFQLNSATDMFDDAPPPDLIPSNEKSRYNAGHQQNHNPSFLSSEVKQQGSTSPDSPTFVPMDPDKIAIRNDTMRAAKRRSWAEHHHNGGATNDEAEHIRMLLCREQQKGKSSVNLSWIFGQLSNGNAQALHGEPKPTVRDDSFDKAESDKLASVPEHSTVGDSTPSPPPEVIPDDFVDHQQEMRQLNDETPPNISMDEDRSSVTIIEVVPDVDIKPAPTKGILRPANVAGSGRRIRFDPLALLLDAALEGELEMVKRCASQITNVSESNDEGITALHNAICAGHYEIVRFLVEADADVNAQDSDGWTPLHCAASCNNLPMVKFLVERGACVFATTVSDHETPADKCEEDEDGFDGCSQFLLNIQEKIGTLNGGKVYAAYDFDAQYGDEIDFKAGDEMVVLNKSDKEKGWWWVRHSATCTEGYVPRNYMALYPRLSLQRALAMSCEIEPSSLIDAVVPQNPIEEVNNEEVNPLPIA